MKAFIYFITFKLSMMRKDSIIIIIIAVLILVVLGIFLLNKPSIFIFPNQTINPINQTTANDTEATFQGVTNVINADNQFAFKLYSKYKDEYKDKNIFYSPYSISTALAMTFEGARGDTAGEMQKIFNFPKENNIRRPAYAKIYNELNKKNKNYTLSTANALWLEKTYAFLDDYKNLILNYYGGKATNLDFKANSESSRITINDWIEENTNNKIKDLIPQGAVNENIRLVLTNAIYFKGKWLEEFNTTDTKEEDFTLSDNQKTKVQMMKKSGKNFNYAEKHNLQVLELAYQGGDLSMLILLPKTKNIKDAESYLAYDKIIDLRNMLLNNEVDVYLPKFKFETKYMMAEDLKQMGMPTAFSTSADFSGIDGVKGNLMISEVIHQAFVEVNEEGTEAAAATAVVLGTTSAEPIQIKTFRADHPFVFLIQERKTGNILFIGKVENPNE